VRDLRNVNSSNFEAYHPITPQAPQRHRAFLRRITKDTDSETVAEALIVRIDCDVSKAKPFERFAADNLPDKRAALCEGEQQQKAEYV